MDLVAYNPPQSLWKLIEDYISPHETEEIRQMLGESLIEQSLDLHSEVETLLDIWRCMREESESKPKAKLPEPPEIRERLINDILFFVKGVKEKAENNGLDPQKIISRHNSDVIQYAIRNESNPETPRSQSTHFDSGRETPMISSKRLLDEAEVVQDVIGMNEKFNFLQFDQVVASLRSHLEKEVDQLLKDITFLQNCLDSEASGQDGCGSGPGLEREPTLSELREERSSLEKEMLPVTNFPVKPRTNQYSHTNSDSKLAPMRAVHNIVPNVQNIPSTKTILHGKLNLRGPSGINSSRLKVVPVNKVLNRYGDCSRTHLTPSPPPGIDHNTPSPRPGSAARFRRMVLECREGD